MKILYNMSDVNVMLMNSMMKSNNMSVIAYMKDLGYKVKESYVYKDTFKANFTKEGLKSNEYIYIVAKNNTIIQVSAIEL